MHPCLHSSLNSSRGCCTQEMKGEGYYVARGLSFKEAEFQELECKLTAEQRATYDAAVQVCRPPCYARHWRRSFRWCTRRT